MMKKTVFLIYFLSAFTLLSQSLTIFDIDTSNFPTISAKILAVDKDGDMIKNLSANDFIIYENGKQKVHYS